MVFGRRGDDLLIGVPRAALRPSPVFLAVVAVFVASGWMAWTGYGSTNLDVFLFVVSGWVASLCLHEYAHAVFAFRAGDVDVARRGYLTLNPLKYANPVLSIVLPVVFIILGGIALPGGAVWVNHGAIRGRLKESLISLAGPAINVLFAIALLARFATGTTVVDHHDFWAAVSLLAFFQLTAAVLNLLPIPGVDGGNAVRPWLSYEYRRAFDAVAPYGMLLLFALLWTPRINALFFQGLIVPVGGALGLSGDLVRSGFDLFRFWTGTGI
ncbi:MAG TPA: site-2 protease family protein [Micromonosporaceae bacterium]